MYKSPVIYNLLIRIGRKSTLSQRYHKISDEVGESKTVFELGCGTGLLYPFLDQSCDYIGWDLNQKFVEHCKKRGLKCFEKDIFDFEDYPENDTIILCDVLHHLPRKSKLLVNEALKRTNKLIVVEPYEPYKTILPALLFKIKDMLLGDNDGINEFERRIKWEYSPKALREYFMEFPECTKTEKIGEDIFAVLERGKFKVTPKDTT